MWLEFLFIDFSVPGIGFPMLYEHDGKNLVDEFLKPFTQQNRNFWSRYGQINAISFNFNFYLTARSQFFSQKLTRNIYLNLIHFGNNSIVFGLIQIR